MAFVNTMKKNLIKLNKYAFFNKMLIYAILSRKQLWKNKDFKKTAKELTFNLNNFYLPSLNNPKSYQSKELFKKIEITIPSDGFITSIDEFKTLNRKGLVMDNISVDYSLILNNSLNDLKLKYDDSSEFGQQQIEFLEAVELLIDRFVEKIKSSDRLDKEEFIQYFEDIKTKRANSFKESLQRILFFNQMFWQTGHFLNGLGRLDLVLNDIYTSDNISRDESLILIKDFIKATHRNYYYKSGVLIGDTGQIIVLGGIDENNNYFTNDLTYLFMDAIKDLQLPDPKLILRYSKNIPKDLMELALNTMNTGVGSPLISNDDVVIENLINFGYEKSDAYNYVVSACWEPAPIGKSLELNNLSSIIFLKPLNELLDSKDLNQIKSFDGLLNMYKDYLKYYLNNVLDKLNETIFEQDPLLSLFIEKTQNKDLSKGSAKYNNYGLTSVALSNTVNSLYNIKKLVFDENKYSLAELNEFRKNNFEDESIKSLLTNQKKFGMDDEEIIYITNEITKTASNICASKTNRHGGKFKFGLSSPDYINGSVNMNASLDGRRDFEPFNVHISNEDNKDYTELMRFASKLDYTEHRFNGNVVDFMVSPDFITKNFDKFLDFIKMSLDMGVFQMQLNVVDSKTLIDAQNNPDRYPNLIVRVWGFSSYFKDLPKEYQDVLIKRALENEGKNN